MIQLLPATSNTTERLLLALYLQNWMDYELRAVWFDYNCSIFGAEHVRQVSPLEMRKKMYIQYTIRKKIKKWMDKIDSQALLPTTFKAEMAAK